MEPVVESIKQNLEKKFFDQQAEILTSLELIDKLIRSVNTARFNETEDFEKLQLEKVNEKKHLEEISEQFKEYFTQFIANSFMTNDKKKIIQVYLDKLAPFAKKILEEAVENAKLQIKIDKIIISIGKQGTPIQDLIDQTKKEAQAKPAQKNNSAAPASKAPPKPAVAEATAPKVPETTEAALVEPPKPKEVEQKTGEKKEEESKNPAPNANPVKKEAPSQQSAPVQKKATTTTNSKSDNTNNNNNNKSKTNQQKATDTQHTAEHDSCCQPSNKNAKRIVQSSDYDFESIEIRNEPPDSVMKYKIIQMSDAYELQIKAIEPDQNSHPICEYEVYLILPKSQSQIDSTDWDMLATLSTEQILFEKHLFVTSPTPLITIDLSKIPTKFLKYRYEQEALTYFSIVAKSSYKSSSEPAPKYLSSKIKAIFQLNVPKIINEPTKLLMTGSTSLIQSTYFRNKSVFEGSLTSDCDSITSFLPLDNEDIFEKVQPQQVDVGPSVLTLLKNGTVLQWGEVIIFQGDQQEYPPEQVEEIYPGQVDDIFMPVQDDQVIYKIAQGQYHYAGVSLDGKVFTWGLNNFGQLGHQNYVSYPDPKRVDLLADQFIVDVQCGKYMTVCLSIKGELFTFGKSQSPEGDPIYDLYESVINYSNTMYNQLAPRKIVCDEKIVQFSVSEGHCVFLTENNKINIWGDNTYLQVSQTNIQFYPNYAHPIGIEPMNSKGFVVEKVIALIQTNIAVARNLETNNLHYIRWGGEQKKWLDYKGYGATVYVSNPNDDESVSLSNDSYFVCKHNGQLQTKGNNFQHRIGLSTNSTDIKQFQQVPLPLSKVVSISIGQYNTAIIITQKTLQQKTTFID